MRTLAIVMVGALIVWTTDAAARPLELRRVSTAGTVWINAAALPSGSTVYDGDTIATAENGFALITSPGQNRSSQADRNGHAEIRSDSFVSVGTEEITLQGGVVGSDGFAVRLGQDVIRPANGALKNWFVVADRDGQKAVAAYQGDLLIARADGEPIIVPAGSYAVPDEPGTKSNGNGLPRKIPGNGSGNGWTIFSFTGAGAILLVTIGAAAAGATMLGFAIADNPEPISPSQ